VREAFLSTVVAGAVVSFLVATAVHAEDAPDRNATEIRAAVSGLYRALAAADVASLVAYLPAEGFSEFSPPESSLKTLDLEYFRRAFAAGVRVQLHVENEQVRIHGDGAVVTAFRVGTIGLPQGQRLDLHDCMTMVWSRKDKAWLLRHVHISACPSSPG
jgi:ketosteroid isomerase-like protein